MSVTQSILPYSVEGVVCNSICPIVAVYCLAALGRCVCRPLQDCIFQCPLIDLSSSRALHTVLGVKGLLHIRPYSTYAKLLLERLLFVCYSKVTWSPLTLGQTVGSAPAGIAQLLTRMYSTINTRTPTVDMNIVYKTTHPQ